MVSVGVEREVNKRQVFFLIVRPPPRCKPGRLSAALNVYKRKQQVSPSRGGRKNP